MKKTISLLSGDGVGPEIISEAVKVLQKISEIYDHEFQFHEALIGAIAIDQTGDPYPSQTHNLCIKSDAILFGAIGDPKYDNDPSAQIRPEQGLLKMRKALGLYANVRPIYTYASLIESSPLKPDRIKNADFVIIRELTGGLYFGKKGRRSDGVVFDTLEYTKEEVMRVSHFAFQLAMKRAKPPARPKLTVVDKANVLETSRLWRETVLEMCRKYTDVHVDFMFVDNAAMQIIKRPTEFDVILTENMFGDILTDEASVITGSIGMLPSASIGEKTSLYEPIHGSYPKAAGQNTANPCGTILSASMMLEYSFGMKDESRSINQAVRKVIDNEYGTKDLGLKNTVSTSQFGDLVCQYISKQT